jgi:hypothetical protein
MDSVATLQNSRLIFFYDYSVLAVESLLWYLSFLKIGYTATHGLNYSKGL